MSGNDPKKNPDEKKNPPRLNIKLNEEVAKGQYANLAIIHNNESEFVLDFAFMEPQRRQGQVVSRVIANPRTAKRMLLGLSEMIRMFEERFGTIEVPEPGEPKSTYH